MAHAAPAVLEHKPGGRGDVVHLKGDVGDALAVGGDGGPWLGRGVAVDLERRPAGRRAPAAADGSPVRCASGTPVPRSSHAPERSRDGGTGVHPNTSS